MPATEIQYAACGEVELAYDTFGDRAAPPVVLIAGLGMQMLSWYADFCELLAREHFVVRFDNRDVGLSTHFDLLPAGDPMALAAGDASSATYRLSDMAADVVGLLDALGLERAHLVGASLGGMIGQTVAIDAPDRVASLTSLISTTGDPSVGFPTRAALEQLMRPAAEGRDAVIARALESARLLGSPSFALDEAAIRRRTGDSYDRRFDPAGVSRQLVAIGASGDRTAALRALDVPALVVHGDADPLIDVSGGRATAAALRSSVLEVIPGMGHDLPRGAWPTLVSGISALVASSSR